MMRPTSPFAPGRLRQSGSRAKCCSLGAGLAGIVIVFAVISGLSANAPRSGPRQQGEPSQTSPPESIAQASSQYDARDLTRGDRSTIVTSAPNPNALAPPLDAMWSGPPSNQSTQNAAPPSAPDPETTAHSSPILFASSSSGGVAAGAARPTGADRLEAALSPPRSPYEVQAGAIIPAALITGLNSDLPGRVIAQVTASVYDSVTGAQLLIPQGARLIGAYDNSVHYGDNRIVLVWNRLIMPNGWSIDLADMPGTDPTGAAGVGDRTNNHLWRLGGAIGLSAIISVIANNSEDERGSQSLTQSLGEAAAQQAAQTGGRIVERELTVHPTLQVRPGANVRVLVTRDIALRPYVEARGDVRPSP